MFNLNADNCVTSVKGNIRFLFYTYPLETMDFSDLQKLLDTDDHTLGTGTLEKCKIVVGVECRRKTYGPKHCIEYINFINDVIFTCNCGYHRTDWHATPDECNI